ncbi:hypothetical protein MMYC01_202516 [Madurella mycetomatis]|uniref:Uncharacterized protein n=1 Tax=Madurella mycetomatis TaxID=100816 RepID=A0A175WCK7_9PEZI|nr:hypothetical protein MMYC01_202516 [Madurella mycetomatis]
MDSESPYRTRIHKFSSKPPGHDALRQRENQRRHRARVKGRIAQLEAALSSAQAELGDALIRIENLTAEVRRLHRALESAPQGPASAPAPHSQARVTDTPITLQPGVAVSVPTSREEELAQQLPSMFDESPQAGKLRSSVDACASCMEVAAPDTARLTTPNTARAARGPNDPHPLPKSIPELQPRSLSNSVFDDLEDDCPFLPPPGAGESTMPCRDAYSIIKDRSTPEFSLSEATNWLKPGFRRAIVPGSGCRVQTHVLFAFVDHMISI